MSGAENRLKKPNIVQYGTFKYDTVQFLPIRYVSISYSKYAQLCYSLEIGSVGERRI